MRYRIHRRTPPPVAGAADVPGLAGLPQWPLHLAGSPCPCATATAGGPDGGDRGHPSRVPRALRQFEPVAINQVWVADLTYIPTREGWRYLAVVEDLYSRLIVGWSMGERMTSRLVVDALEMAVSRRLPGEGLVAYSDRGSQTVDPVDSLQGDERLSRTRQRALPSLFVAFGIQRLGFRQPAFQITDAVFMAGVRRSKLQPLATADSFHAPPELNRLSRIVASGSHE